jgi:hypothetical protein
MYLLGIIDQADINTTNTNIILNEAKIYYRSFTFPPNCKAIASFIFATNKSPVTSRQRYEL